ncbi:hypothetical protein [Selenomonas sp. ND2010]|jgi:hypothetical protein|uniref:hypothetical protein n=1 Tax=Selenomonas sp. ND2010 TaxID=1410618 RepID=UPI00051AD9A9|nr:hypothetical protein [Selenomonas sp. ND2010]
MKKSLRCFGIGVLLLTTTVTSGCTVWESFAIARAVLTVDRIASRHDNLPKNPPPVETYQNFKTKILRQQDGKGLSIDLPFKLDYVSLPAEGNVKSAERYFHHEDRCFVDIYHGSMADPGQKMPFNLDSFMKSYQEADKMHPVLKTCEQRTINGQEMTYALIQFNGYGNKQTMECLGVYSGNDFWIISYGYKEDDSQAKQMVERSMKSVKRI